MACEIAVTVTIAGSVLVAVATVGTVFGAVYSPVEESEPQTEPDWVACASKSFVDYAARQEENAPES